MPKIKENEIFYRFMNFFVNVVLGNFVSKAQIRIQHPKKKRIIKKIETTLQISCSWNYVDYEATFNFVCVTFLI